MTQQELLKKLHIESLSPEEQANYVKQLVSTASTLAGLRLFENLSQAQRSRVDSLLTDSGADVESQMKQIIDDENQQKAFLTAFNDLVEEISDDLNKDQPSK